MDNATDLARKISKMAKKKSTKRQLSLKMGVNDERIPKIGGILFLFLALYLFIAFSSHIFTWQVDQNVFSPFSWTKLFNSDLVVENWLGRLGAAISNMFFFWGFGLPSFVFVFLFAALGFGLINRVPLRNYLPVLRYGLVMMLFFSVLFEYIFRSSEFPWGGAFGDNVCGWLVKFVGNVGTFFVFVLLIAMLIVWIFNPNFHEMNRQSLGYQIKDFFNNLRSGRFPAKRKPAPQTSSELNSGGLRPRNFTPPEETKPDHSLTLSNTPAPLTVEAETPNLDVTSPPETTLPLEEAPIGEQLAFDLEKAKMEKSAPLATGESNLEINESAGKGDDEIGESPPMLIATENSDHGEPYDPTLELSSYEHPVVSLLQSYDDQKIEIDRAELEQKKDQIIATLLNYKIEITKIKATVGPTVTLYEIVPAAGVRISRIKNLEDDIALSLAALGIRIIAPIPGKGTIGIEVPNKNKQMVALKEILLSEKFKRGKMDLPIALGKTISNEVFVADLAKMPHLLIAGATGQGKSVGINVILMSLLYKKHPSQVKFVLIDPKKVELFPYSRIVKHFLAYLPGLDEPIVTDTTKVIHTLNSLLIEMDDRYNLLKKAQARNITEYNKKFVARKLNPNNGHHFLPFIVLIIDEFADLIMTAGKEIELPIGRLAQLSRAVGIHLVIATQRPSVNIITGVIKANFPARIAYRVTAKVDSRTILDTGGADRLVGRGDMLLSFGSDLVRLQCAFVDTPEVEKVIDFIENQRGYPQPYFLPEFVGDDDKEGPGAVNTKDLDSSFKDAARLVVSNQHGSTSMIQRRLKLGYNRAGRIMDQLEALGIVGPSEGSKAREVLIFDEVQLERYLEEILNRK